MEWNGMQRNAMHCITLHCDTTQHNTDLYLFVILLAGYRGPKYCAYLRLNAYSYKMTVQCGVVLLRC